MGIKFMLYTYGVYFLKMWENHFSGNAHSAVTKFCG